MLEDGPVSDEGPLAPAAGEGSQERVADPFDGPFGATASIERRVLFAAGVLGVGQQASGVASRGACAVALIDGRRRHVVVINHVRRAVIGKIGRAFVVIIRREHAVETVVSERDSLSLGVGRFDQVRRGVVNIGGDATVRVVHEHLALQSVVLHHLHITLRIGGAGEAIIQVVIIKGRPVVNGARGCSIVV